MTQLDSDLRGELDGTDPGSWDDALRPRLRVHEVLARASARYPEMDAVVDDTGRLTYAGLSALVEAIAGSLKAGGVEQGDRVATLVSAGNVGTALLYAISQVGAVSVPINEMHAAPEVADALSRSGARHFVLEDSVGAPAALGLAADDLLAEDARPGLAVLTVDGDLRWQRAPMTARRAKEPDGIALVLFTSGSTAKAKGVLVTHEGLVGTAHYCALAMSLTATDRLLDMMPSYHVGGLADGILAAHLTGGACVIARFEPARFLELCERERITATIGFAPMIDTIFSAPGYSPDRHAHWRAIAISQATEALIMTLRSAGVHHIAYGFGLTEASGDVTLSRPWLSDIEAVESVGLPLPGLDVRIVDPVTEVEVPPGDSGEIRVKGWSLCRGYIDGSDALDGDGFWKTGDLGSVRSPGTIQFNGRIKFMIKSGGENVSLHEVEEFLRNRFPEIEEAAVVGVPDDRWGEMVVAFVAFVPGRSLDPAELKQRCRGEIAGYKIPKKFLLIDGIEWPLTPVGKVDRQRLVSLAAARLSRSKP